MKSSIERSYATIMHRDTSERGDRRAESETRVSEPRGAKPTHLFVERVTRQAALAQADAERFCRGHHTRRASLRVVVSHDELLLAILERTILNP